MLPRTLEPEVMEGEEEAREYDAMDHGEVNRRFVDDLLGAMAGLPERRGKESRVLDLGTGTARIPIELARRESGTAIWATDLGESMLELAGRNLAEAGLADRIRLEQVDSKHLPYEDGAFDVVMSNTLVHHLPEPAGSLAEMARVARPGGLVFVRDLARPADLEAVEELVARHAAGETERQRQLLRDSLHAALTVGEVRDMLARLGLPGEGVAMTSDRHWTWRWVRPEA